MATIENPYDYLNKSDEELEAFLNHLKDAYYNSEALVSDEIFDDLSDELYHRNPKAKFFSEVGYQSNNDIKLPYKMYSLDKITPTKNNFDLWIKKYNGPYTVSDKLDGISCLVVKVSKTKTNLYLRSTADYGSDITYILPYINIDVKPLPINYAIRGELIISKEHFEEIKTKNPEYTAARGSVNGIIKRKTIDKQLLKYVDFVAYSIVNPRLEQSKQYKQLQDWGFITTPFKKFKTITEHSMVEYLTKRRGESKYDIDGIVICDNSKVYDYPTKRNPEYMIAFKSLYEGQAQRTTVKYIKWNISKLGVYKPTVYIEPVEILNSTVKKTTGHNAKFIVDNNLGPGADIIVIKSGDIIPYILKVLKPAEEPQMPDEKYIWNDSKVEIILPNKHSTKQEKDKIIKQLINTMDVLDVVGFGEKRVKAIANICDCDSLCDIVNVPMNKIIEILGPKNGPKIYNDLINKIQNASLPQMMIASNCFDSGLIGIKRIKLVLKEIPDILVNTNKNLRDIIINIPSFEEKTADAVLDGLENFKIFLADFNSKQNKIKLKYDIKKEIDKFIENKEFNYKKIVLTGFRDKNIQEFIESAGAEVSTSISKKTDLLIVSDINSVKDNSKYKKAIELNIAIIEKDDFIEKYMN